MGAAIALAKRNTSVEDRTSGKLEYNPVNEQLLNSICKFVESYPSGKPEAKMVFKSPLVWISDLQPSHFGGAYEQRGAELVSEEKISEKDETPLLRLKAKTDKFEMTVYTIEHCQNIITTAGDKKLHEVRACLEANSDPVAQICGDRFAEVEGQDTDAQRFVEEVLKGGDEDEAKDKKVTFNLLLAMRNLDKELLNKLIKQMTDKVRLSPALVDQEVEGLRKFSGEDEETTVLEYIDYVENGDGVVFSNGCRALPLRQLHGDICYLEIKPHDVDDQFYVTASTQGYYVIKGIENGGNLDLEREGDIYRSLILIIRTKSPKFAEMIDKKEFSVTTDDKDRNLVDTTGDLDTEDTGEVTQRSEREPTKTQLQLKDDSRGMQKSRKDQTKKKLQPSLKWKNLGLEEEKEKQEKAEKEEKEDKYGKKSSMTPSKRFRRPKAKTPMDAEDSFSESDTESEEEEETPDRRNEANSDLPSEYWQIQKLVKYLKSGNQTATIIALCAMRDFNLGQETCQFAIRDVGGLEVLINLLDTDDIRCKIGSLKILKEISMNTQIRRLIADLGGLQTMVKILGDQNKDLKCLSAETIAHVAKFRRARRTVRQHGGIKKLVSLLDCPSPVDMAVMTPETQKDIEVARNGALALWSCSKSTKNKQAMRRAGVIPLLAKLLKSTNEDMLIPVVGTLQECASEQSYRLAIRTEGMIEDLVANFKSENTELQMHCASAIFKCAEEKETRDLVRQYGGLDPLGTLLRDKENKELLAAATGAIWKCAISPENVLRFQELKVIDQLVGALHDQPEEVLVNVVGALAECGKDPQNRMAIRKAGGIGPLVNLLTGTNQKLLVNVTRAVGQCAEEADNMAIIDRLDGVRLLWSLLKNQNTEVQASAAWAICPCIENAKDAGEMVRSFVGGLELIVSLLKSDDREVLASVCAAIANIAKDEENLAVITDHGVVPMLAFLTNTTDDRLRQHLAEAIARCCSWGNNRKAFGKECAVSPLVCYLKSEDPAVHRSTAKALFQLSKTPENCIVMHEAGVVKPLMEMVGSSDEVLQEAAAGCIGNIRRLALANEKARFS